MDRFWLPTAFLAMEAAWLAGAIAVWGRWIDPADPAPLLPLSIVAVTLVGGYLAGSSLLRVSPSEDEELAPPARHRGRTALSLTLACLWALPAVWLARHVGEGPGWIAGLPAALGRVIYGPTTDLAAVASVLLIWARGQQLSERAPDYAAVVRSFGLGALLLTGGLLLTGSAGTPPALAAATPLFLAGGLTALALTRLRDAGEELESGVAVGNAAGLPRAWLRSVGPPVATVLGAAFVVSFVLGDAAWRHALAVAAAAAGPLLDWLQSLLWTILYWPLIAIGHLAEFLIYLLQRNALHPQPQDAQQGNPSDDLAEQLRRMMDTSPRDWPGAVRWGVAAIAAGLLLGTLLATARVARRHVGMRANEGGERETVWSWRAVWRAPYAWLLALLWRWRARGGALAALLAEGLDRSPETRRREEVEDARRAYRRMLGLGRAHGLPRGSAQTPHEYNRAWQERLPGERDAAALTEAYVQARYGPDAGPPPERGAIQAALVRLAAALRSVATPPAR